LQVVDEIASKAPNLATEHIAQHGSNRCKDEQSHNARSHEQPKPNAHGARRNGHKIRPITECDFRLIAHVFEHVACVVDAIAQGDTRVGRGRAVRVTSLLWALPVAVNWIHRLSPQIASEPSKGHTRAIKPGDCH
jgi:hypothetical protein